MRSAQSDFISDDLYANREGRLSDEQRRRLRLVLLRDTLVYGIVALLPLGLALVLLTGQGNSPIVIGLLVLLSLAFVAYLVSLHLATRADLAAGVSVVSGKVETCNVGRGLYRLYLDGQSFQVSGKVFSAFADGHAYRIYYTPRLKTILSAEALEG